MQLLASRRQLHDALLDQSHMGVKKSVNLIAHSVRIVLEG